MTDEDDEEALLQHSAPCVLQRWSGGVTFGPFLLAVKGPLQLEDVPSFSEAASGSGDFVRASAVLSVCDFSAGAVGVSAACFFLAAAACLSAGCSGVSSEALGEVVASAAAL